MPRRSNESPGFASDAGRSRAATALYVVGVVTVAANSALYFFGADSLSHPAISVLGVVLLLPLYLKERS